MVCTTVTTKWLDTKKETSRYPTIAAGRLVVRCSSRRPPPLQKLKVLCSMYARGQMEPELFQLPANAVTRALVKAPARRPIFIEVSTEDLDHGGEGCAGQLQWILNGTRDAAQHWEHEYTNFLVGLGFQTGRASPRNFAQQARRISLTVFGDVFAIVADKRQLAWLRWSTRGSIRWTTAGLEYELDQRHAQRGGHCRVELGNCKFFSTPCFQ